MWCTATCDVFRSSGTKHRSNRAVVPTEYASSSLFGNREEEAYSWVAMHAMCAPNDPNLISGLLGHELRPRISRISTDHGQKQTARRTSLSAAPAPSQAHLVGVDARRKHHVVRALILRGFAVSTFGR